MPSALKSRPAKLSVAARIAFLGMLPPRPTDFPWSHSPGSSSTPGTRGTADIVESEALDDDEVAVDRPLPSHSRDGERSDRLQLRLLREARRDGQAGRAGVEGEALAEGAVDVGLEVGLAAEDVEREIGRFGFHNL